MWSTTAGFGISSRRETLSNSNETGRGPVTWDHWRAGSHKCKKCETLGLFSHKRKKTQGDLMAAFNKLMVVFRADRETCLYVHSRSTRGKIVLQARDTSYNLFSYKL